MKIIREEVNPDQGSSFKLLLTPGLQDTFLWHFHPEYEIVYVEGSSGTRHVGDHISVYEGSDLVFIGPNIPHLNFDYGVRTACEQVIVQMREDFLGRDFLQLPEMTSIRRLFGQAAYGISFSGETKAQVGLLLKNMHSLDGFDQLLALIGILKILADSREAQVLNLKPAGDRSLAREQKRMELIYAYVESRYDKQPDVHEVAALTGLTTPAFCRVFKKTSRMTFTDFVNQFRVNQAKNLLLQDHTVSEACFAVGFESLSYFNKLFGKLVGENPSAFKRRYLGK